MMHLIALSRRAYPDSRRGRFAASGALVGTFDAVVDRVAHDVQQRLEQHFHDRFVGLGIVTFDFQLQGLAEVRRHLAYHARKPLQHRAQRQHSHAEHGLLQFGNEPVENDRAVL